MPSQSALSGSRLRFSNGSTAILFSTIAKAECVGLRRSKTKAIIAQAQAAQRSLLPSAREPAFLHGLEFLRQLRIAELIVVKVHHRDAHAMFRFACAKIVQKRRHFVFFEIFGDMFRKEDVPASPQSITRFAMLIPAPARLALCLHPQSLTVPWIPSEVAGEDVP